MITRRATRASSRAAEAAAVTAAATRATSAAVTRATSGSKRPRAPRAKAGPSKPSKRKRGAAANDEDEEDEDEDEDEASRPNKKERKARDATCDFCKTDPVGMQMAQQRPCDWEKKFKECYVECSNCADHRSQNPNLNHSCQPPRVRHVWRKYGVADPNIYNPQACDRCVSIGRQLTCNADTILGYSCTQCKDQACIVNGQQLEKRINLRLNFKNWIRHECEGCHHRSKRFSKQRNFVGCSFLTDRSTWGQPCNRCRQQGIACFNSGFMIWNPPITAPSTWHVDLNFYKNNWADVRGGTPWRQNCKRCLTDRHPCRVDLKAPYFACARCSQLGLDCCDDQTNIFRPLFDLARVGFGRLMPFQECNRCAMTGRNCDHQRPCDSCIKNNEEGLCDIWVRNSNKNHNCINGRIDPNPGPLYYLALGYGAGGVDDPKDGSRIEHWVGPMSNIYQMKLDKQRPMGIAEAGYRSRGFLKPPGQPPHGAQNAGSNMMGQPSGLSAQNIVTMIQGMWAQARAPNQHPLYQRTMTDLQDRIQEIEQENDDAGGADADDDSDSADDEIIVRIDNGEGSGDGGGGPGGGDGNQGGVNQGALVQGYINQGYLIPHDANGNDFDFEIEPPDKNQGDPAYQVAHVLAGAVAHEDNSGQSSAAGILPGADPITHDDSAPVNQMQVEAESNPFYADDMMDIDMDPPVSYPPPAQASSWTPYNPPNPTMPQIPQMPYVPAAGNVSLISDFVLFGHVQGQEVPGGVPFRNVLGSVSELFDAPGFGSELRCVEISALSGLPCNTAVDISAICKCISHGGNLASVCDFCAQVSAEALVSHNNVTFISDVDMINMRAYLCDECAHEVSTDANALNRRRKAGIYNVWGRIAGDPTGHQGLVRFSNGDINFKGDALAATGCTCATKAFLQRLCSFHRTGYVNDLVHHSKLMQEWRLRKFGRAICPGCIVNKSADEANVSADSRGVGPKAWACLTCGDWVINQPSIPKMVPGWAPWFFTPPAWS